LLDCQYGLFLEQLQFQYFGSSFHTSFKFFRGPSGPPYDPRAPGHLPRGYPALSVGLLRRVNLQLVENDPPLVIENFDLGVGFGNILVMRS